MLACTAPESYSDGQKVASENVIAVSNPAALFRLRRTRRPGYRRQSRSRPSADSQIGLLRLSPDVNLHVEHFRSGDAVVAGLSVKAVPASRLAKFPALVRRTAGKIRRRGGCRQVADGKFIGQSCIEFETASVGGKQQHALRRQQAAHCMH